MPYNALSNCCLNVSSTPANTLPFIAPCTNPVFPYSLIAAPMAFLPTALAAVPAIRAVPKLAALTKLAGSVNKD